MQLVTCWTFGQLSLALLSADLELGAGLEDWHRKHAGSFGVPAFVGSEKWCLGALIASLVMAWCLTSAEHAALSNNNAML